MAARPKLTLKDGHHNETEKANIFVSKINIFTKL